jgi:hypothetical protein
MRTPRIRAFGRCASSPRRRTPGSRFETRRSEQGSRARATTCRSSTSSSTRRTTTRRSSDAIKKQTAIGVFNCDCFGYGLATKTEIGHSPGDVEAALESQRAARLVRRILMSSYYINLGLLKLVGSRFPLSLETMRVSHNDGAQNVACTRLALEVTFNEYSPQYLAELLEKIVFSARRSEGGELLYSVTLDFPSP